MKILLIHAEELWYKTHKPAIKNPPDPPGEFQAENAAVVFVSVEKGDGERAVDEASKEIVKYAGETVKADWIVIYPYAHLSSNLEKPRRAHSILVRLENKVRELWNGNLHRAPFGWYKEFRLHGKGHPLAELSRSIGEQGRVAFRVVDGEITVSEAVSKGLAPRCLGRRVRRLEGLAGEKEELLGLRSWNSWLALGLVERLARRLEDLGKPWGSLYSLKPYTPPEDLDDIEAVARLYSEAVALGARRAGSPMPSAVVRVDVGVEILDDLSNGITKRITRINTCGDPPCLEIGASGEILLYESPKGYCLPIGVATGGNVFLGPLGNIVKAVIDHEASRAEVEDWVPRLPAWMHPVTAYIVPLSGASEYALSVARDLASLGAGVAVDESQSSVGGRVRSAGKLWVPLVLTVGKREVETGTVTVRRRWRPGSQEAVTLGELLLEVRSLLSWSGVSGFVLHLT
ncbi:MAG: hypothetical protein F7C33_05910 [Desulfurococcales archaeon]|nr:hypothetical protein [Desulfurococcales archaeon]